jgi:hypothetical protein
MKRISAVLGVIGLYAGALAATMATGQGTIAYGNSSAYVALQAYTRPGGGVIGSGMFAVGTRTDYIVVGLNRSGTGSSINGNTVTLQGTGFIGQSRTGAPAQVTIVATDGPTDTFEITAVHAGGTFHASGPLTSGNIVISSN